MSCRIEPIEDEPTRALDACMVLRCRSAAQPSCGRVILSGGKVEGGRAVRSAVEVLGRLKALGQNAQRAGLRAAQRARSERGAFARWCRWKAQPGLSQERDASDEAAALLWAISVDVTRG